MKDRREKGYKKAPLFDIMFLREKNIKKAKEEEFTLDPDAVGIETEKKQARNGRN